MKKSDEYQNNKYSNKYDFLLNQWFLVVLRIFSNEQTVDISK